MLNRFFADYLKSLRHQRGLSLEALARQAQVSVRTLHYWESGQRAPRNQELDSVLRVLGATPSERTQAFALLATPRALQQVRQEVKKQVPQRVGESLPGIGDLLRALRQRKGWTQVHLAEAIGVQRSTVQRWENSETHPSEESLERISILLEASAAEQEALRTHSLIPLSELRPLSLEESIEQERAFNARVWEQDALIDLRALALKRHLRLLPNPSHEILGLLAQVETDHGFWLLYQNRIAESRQCVERSIAIVRVAPGNASYRSYPLNLASAHHTLSGKPLHAFHMLKRWLSQVSRERQFTLLCDMAIYAAQANRLEEARTLLTTAHREMGHAQLTWTDGDVEEYYRLTETRILLFAEKPVEAMSLLTPIRSTGLRELFDLLLWAEVLLAGGDTSATSNILARMETLLIQYPFPRLTSHLKRLSREL